LDHLPLLQPPPLVDAEVAVHLHVPAGDELPRLRPAPLAADLPHNRRQRLAGLAAPNVKRLIRRRRHRRASEPIRPPLSTAVGGSGTASGPHKLCSPHFPLA